MRMHSLNDAFEVNTIFRDRLDFNADAVQLLRDKSGAGVACVKLTFEVAWTTDGSVIARS